MSNAPIWSGFLVVNSECRVLGVYGSALRQMAEEQRDIILSQHPLAQVKVITYISAQRPQVGDKVS